MQSLTAGTGQRTHDRKETTERHCEMHLTASETARRKLRERTRRAFRCSGAEIRLGVPHHFVWIAFSSGSRRPPCKFEMGSATDGLTPFPHETPLAYLLDACAASYLPDAFQQKASGGARTRHCRQPLCPVCPSRRQRNLAKSFPPRRSPRTFDQQRKKRSEKNTNLVLSSFRSPHVRQFRPVCVNRPKDARRWTLAASSTSRTLLSDTSLDDDDARRDKGRMSAARAPRQAGKPRSIFAGKGRLARSGICRPWRPALLQDRRSSRSRPKSHAPL